MKRFVGAALAAGLNMAVMVPALAQAVITDPAGIAACLCDQQAVTLLMGRVDLAQHAYDADRAGIEALDRRIGDAKAHLDVANQGQIDALKAMNLEREALYARTYDVELPAAQAAVQDYNQAVGRYSRRCAGRALDPLQVEQVRQTLSCPVTVTRRRVP